MLSNVTETIILMTLLTRTHIITTCFGSQQQVSVFSSFTIDYSILGSVWTPDNLGVSPNSDTILGLSATHFNTVKVLSMMHDY